MVYYTRRFVLSLTLYYFDLVFFSPFSIAITSLGKERANLTAYRTFVRFALVWFCLFPLPLGVLEGLRLVFVALTRFFSYLFCVFGFSTSHLNYIPTFDISACFMFYCRYIGMDVLLNVCKSIDLMYIVHFVSQMATLAAKYWLGVTSYLSNNSFDLPFTIA